jgi:hypothetical protein
MSPQFTLDSMLFDFDGNDLVGGNALAHTLKIARKECQRRNMADVKVEPVIVDSITRRWVQGDEPVLLKRVQALVVTDQHDIRNTFIIRWGALKASESIFKTIAEVEREETFELGGYA